MRRFIRVVFVVSAILGLLGLSNHEAGAQTVRDFRAPNRATINTAETTASATYTDLATVGPAATCPAISAAGEALVLITASITPATATGGSPAPDAFASVAVSGASTIAAADANIVLGTGIKSSAAAQGLSTQGTVASYFTGLTTGSNTFTMKYKCPDSGANTCAFGNRQIIVFCY